MDQGSHVLLQGNVPTAVHILLEGQAYRYRLLEDGRRQIVAILVPGDICDLEAVMRGRADYGVATMTNCVLGELPVNTIADLRTIDPELAQALVGQSAARPSDRARVAGQRGVPHGHGTVRTSDLRASTCACKAVGLTKGDAFKLEMTQAEIADLLGLSTVHVNRTLKQLRASRPRPLLEIDHIDPGRPRSGESGGLQSDISEDGLKRAASIKAAVLSDTGVR